MSSGTPAMAAKTSGEVEEFSAFLDRYHTDARLRQVHFVRLGFGLFWSLAVIAFNRYRIAPPGAEPVVTQIATVVCAVHVVACLATLIIARRRFLADLRHDAISLRERAWLVVQFVQRRANLLLILAATGQLLVLLGTEFKLRLFAADGEVLLVALVPTLLLLVHGLGDIPTRARLCQIYVWLARQQMGPTAS